MYDEINQNDMRGLQTVINSTVRGILDAFGPISFEDVLVRVCYQLALSATRYVIEAVKNAYNDIIDRYKNEKQSRF